MDPRRPKKLKDERKEAIRSEPEIRRLRSKKDGLLKKIREKYTFVYKAKTDAVYEECQKTKLDTHDAIRSRERAPPSRGQEEVRPGSAAKRLTRSD